ncbi:trypsin-like peptidase domain-containing protein [Haloferula sp. BvORR071]|uniref:trypsin-like peptidase domain-containing protein n=1 Tax=Haloferula sp. BvORR071 TaxID=1396141 RepID=UPI002240F09B|nr:trypsin-like peptidase domain-containing protein [Haloferula sp. BvORR071]
MKRVLIALLLSFLTLRSAKATDFATEMLGATFKFFHPDSTSTCVLVRREADPALYLVTCAHTLERTKGDTATLVLRQAEEDGSYSRHDHTITIRRGEQALWTRHAKEDVAVLKLEGELPVKVAGLPESALLDEAGLRASGVHLCSPLFVLTFPERFEANGAGFPVARQGIFASPPLLPEKSHPTFLGDFTTFAGDSGGPVFIPGEGDHPRVAGIVIGQHHHEIKTTSAFEESTVKLPLGMGIILHASFVRETLAAAAAAAPK